MRMHKLQSATILPGQTAGPGLADPLPQLRARALPVQRELDEAGICAAGDSGDDAASLSFGPADAFGRAPALDSLAALPPAQGPAVGAGAPAETPQGLPQGMGGGPRLPMPAGEGAAAEAGDLLNSAACAEAGSDAIGLAGPGALDRAAAQQTVPARRSAAGAAAQAAGGARKARKGRPSGKRKPGAQPTHAQGNKRSRRTSSQDGGRALVPEAVWRGPVGEGARAGDPDPGKLPSLKPIKGFASTLGERAQAAALAGLGRERLLAALCEAAGACALDIPALGYQKPQLYLLRCQLRHVLAHAGARACPGGLSSYSTICGVRRTAIHFVCMLFNTSAGPGLRVCSTQTLHAGLDGPSDSETDTDDDLRCPAAPPASQPSFTEADSLQAGGPARAELVCGMHGLPWSPLAYPPRVAGSLPCMCNCCQVPASGVPFSGQARDAPIAALPTRRCCVRPGRLLRGGQASDHRASPA